ncbi:hypothetical protein FM076_09675 [Streptomyces albus subsp. chlorinus]|uniref:hypothetical protein n=1 Tax=Streptomyces albus TaxID=1888 RepID=UPI00156F9E43|nr:hypothetical protein [Streptomyces albus]NSC21459.1 hypothetical protein [Streptomyces albus subsp. chlorinus]
MSAGFCFWHRGHALDVELIAVIERGSGPAAGASACLPCARKITGVPYGEAAEVAVEVLEARAGRAEGGSSGAGRPGGRG